MLHFISFKTAKVFCYMSDVDEYIQYIASAFELAEDSCNIVEIYN